MGLGVGPGVGLAVGLAVGLGVGLAVGLAPWAENKHVPAQGANEGGISGPCANAGLAAALRGSDAA